MNRFNAENGMLRWKEPAAFKRALSRQEGHRNNRWYPLLFTLAIVAVCLGGAAFHNKPAFGSWSATVALAVGCGVLVSYGIPFLASRDANLIVITERGFGRRTMRGAGVELECWPWEEVTECRLESLTLEGSSYIVVVMQTRNGELVQFAMNSSVSIDDVAAVIAAHGRELRNFEGITPAEKLK